MVHGTPRPPGHPCAPTTVGIAVALALLLTGGPSPGAATIDHRLPGRIPKSPPSVPGFPILFHRPTDYRPREGSVVAADLDGDGRSELVVTVPSGLVIALRSDGTPLPGWPRTFDDLPQPAYPVGAPGVGDLDGHGSPEIVLCVVSDGPPRVVSDGPPRRNFLYAFHADGSEADGWPVKIRPPGRGYYTCSEAGTLLADLHGDQRMEVARGMSQGDVQVFDGDGTALPG
ncbi:MAG TPA: VCBS repeat-containing protein, partial [Candidatus Polarisedimenticolia bacterium]|nr:VCBS repeat-containing protein [Candidatus Polarisedimenticolia bacterium]